jgi:hypothetical protein
VHVRGMQKLQGWTLGDGYEIEFEFHSGHVITHQ